MLPSSTDRQPERPQDASGGGLLDAMPGEVGILDEGGALVACNGAWHRCLALRRLAEALGGAGERSGERPVAARGRHVDEVVRGVRRVVLGELSEFGVVQPTPGQGEDRWYRTRATRFHDRRAVRVLVVRERLTELEEAQQAVDELTNRLLVAENEQRRRMAQELHDGMVPTIVGLSLDLARLYAGLPEGLRAIGDECIAVCEQALRELRTASFLLHPAMRERVGLAGALRWLADGFGRRSGLAVSLDCDDASFPRLSTAAELSLYRVAQEALVNVHRHTASRSAAIALRLDGDTVRLTVSDQGDACPGWEADAGREGVGIASMRERLRALRGHLEIRAGGGGTVVSATVPHRS